MKLFSGATIAEALARPANGFTLVRLALALAVVVSHAFSVTTGDIEHEPLVHLTGMTLGEHAVNGFFAVSGFLVTMSFLRRGPCDYAIARALRIVPGLVAATLVVALVAGPLLSTLPPGAYLRQPGTWRFITGTLTTFKSNAALPGVFVGNPFTFPMGTVWTLKYEVLCYLGVVGLGVAGLLGRRAVGALLVAGLAVALVVQFALHPEPAKGIETSLRLPLIFAAGGLLYVMSDRVRLSGTAVACAAVATVLAGLTPAYRPVLYLAETYGVIWLSLSPMLARRATDLDTDLSYGTYLYGWPVQQALRQIWPGGSALVLLLPSLVLTLVVAAASWRLVERPALTLKARALGRRTIRTIEPAAP